MQKKTKIIIAFIIVVVAIIGGILTYKLIMKKTPEEKPPVTNVTTVTNKIENYDYTLDDRDTKLFQEKFEELRKVLESETVDQKAYAQTLSELFIIDLYTIDNKISQYDIGGLEYLYGAARESFRSKVLDSLYKTVEDNSYKTRKQNLPIVETIEVISVTPSTYTIDKEKKTSYEVLLNWTYKEDLGYDKKGIVTLIADENKLSVIAYEPTK